MKLSKEFLDFLIKLPKDHREFKDYFAKEEKNIQLFKNISDKDQLIEVLTYSGHYCQIKESIQEIEAYLLRKIFAIIALNNLLNFQLV